jgi:hypothetical protein
MAKQPLAGGNQETRRENFSSVNPVLNPGVCGDKPMSDSLSCGKVGSTRTWGTDKTTGNRGLIQRIISRAVQALNRLTLRAKWTILILWHFRSVDHEWGADASNWLRRIESGIIMLFQLFSMHYFLVCVIIDVSKFPPLRMNKNLKYSYSCTKKTKN